MTDLESRLAGLALPPGPDDPTVGADLARARTALRRRRTRRASVVSLGALAAVGVAAASLAVGTRTSQPEAGPPAAPSTSPSTPSTSSAGPLGDPGPPTGPAEDGVRLVAYRGEQEVGFAVDYVPRGFVLQGADNVSLAVARPGDTTGIFDFRHKIVVTVTPVAAHGPLDPALAQIEVQGRPGTVETRRDGTVVLYYQLDDERLAMVQAWRDVGVTETGLRRFAEGLSVSDDVETVS